MRIIAAEREEFESWQMEKVSDEKTRVRDNRLGSAA